MTEEPELIYIRGQGWVYPSTVSYLYKCTRNGKLMRVEFRRPEIGDWFSYIFLPDNRVVNDSMTEVLWEQDFSRYPKDDYIKCETESHKNVNISHRFYFVVSEV